MNEPISPTNAARAAARLRLAGTLMLVFGLLGGAWVYWRGMPAALSTDDPSLLKLHEPEARQMEMLYGKQGTLIQEWINDLQQPEVQAGLTVVAAVLGAGACFLLARRLNSSGASN